MGDTSNVTLSEGMRATLAKIAQLGGIATVVTLHPAGADQEDEALAMLGNLRTLHRLGMVSWEDADSGEVKHRRYTLTTTGARAIDVASPERRHLLATRDELTDLQSWLRKMCAVDRPAEIGKPGRANWRESAVVDAQYSEAARLFGTALAILAQAAVTTRHADTRAAYLQQVEEAFAEALDGTR